MHFARTVARRAERRLVELTTETNVRNVLLHYINRLSDCLYALARVEDNVAYQNLMIQEITKRYHEANHTPALKERTMPLTFQDLHQLIRSAAMRADELHIPVVISIVDANGTESVTGGCLMPCWSAVNWHRKSTDRRGDENGNPQAC